MRKIITAFLIALWAIPVFAIAPVESDGNASLVTGAHTIFLDNGTGTKGSYSHVTIWTAAGSDAINVNFNQGVTATASDCSIPAGGGLSFGLAGFSAATNQLNYFDAGSGVGSVNWIAY